MTRFANPAVLPEFPPTLAALRALGREQALSVRVSGHCMAPLLRDGEVVQVRPAQLYWPGDVVAFVAQDGRLTVHRALGWAPLRLARPWRQWGLWTQADDTGRPDRAVGAERLLGRVELAAAPTTVARLRAGSRLLAHAWNRFAARFAARDGGPAAQA